LPVVVITGGVHGYETSGVHGALQFVERHGRDYTGRIDLIVVPCVSPWGYERIHRWNPYAVDPNRSFLDPPLAEESAAVMRLVAPVIWSSMSVMRARPMDRSSPRARRGLKSFPK
jgi:predicted deacylase